MHHVAIMKKSWGLLPKIVAGEKTWESRWYKTRRAPWGNIREGDTLYFKDSGAPVTLKSRVAQVLQFEVKDDDEAIGIMKKFGQRDLGSSEIPQSVLDYITGKKYAIFISFDSVQKIEPFDIRKTGFGAMCAWITVGDIGSIKC